MNVWKERFANPEVNTPQKQRQQVLNDAFQ